MNRAILYITVFLFMPIAMGGGQIHVPFSPLPGIDRSDSANPNPNPVEEKRLLNALNSDRQRSMISDTQKLLHLVNELNAEILSTSPEGLSPDQLRKVAEIEKLAHNVREKMSYSVRGTAPYHQPPPVFRR